MLQAVGGAGTPASLRAAHKPRGVCTEDCLNHGRHPGVPANLLITCWSIGCSTCWPLMTLHSRSLTLTISHKRPCFSGLQGDVVGTHLDADAGAIYFSRNGRDLGLAFEVPSHLQRQALYPAMCLKNGEVALNFGGSSLRYQPHPGFTPVDRLPDKCKVSGVCLNLQPAQTGGPSCRSVFLHGPNQDRPHA